MGSGSLGRELDLEVLVTEIKEYLGSVVDPNFTSSGMVTIRLREDGPAFVIYRTGSFQIRGAEDRESLFQSEDLFLKILDNIDFNIRDYEFNQVTSVFLKDFDKDINLEVLSVDLGVENTEYEPEQFPGLIYRPPEYKVTLLIFSSGKVIIGGTTDREEAVSAIESLETELSNLI